MNKDVAPKRVMIIDDEPAARSNLRDAIDSFDELSIIDEIGDGKTAIQAITEQRPDIVFLDIEMPEINGFDVARATSHLNYQLVFVTAYDQYALDAFDTNAIDYLLKPVRPSLLEKCINKIIYQESLVLEDLKAQKTTSGSLVLSDGNECRVLEYQNINYIEGLGRYRRIHLTEAGTEIHRMPTILSDTTLDEFESQLPPQNFVRLHRSYIVAIQQIVGLSTESRRHFAKLKYSGLKIPVSRSKVSELKAIL
ncbi:LytTR family DNA-binding domain-containing protein [Paraferrimonas sp. SM1919]|uniref:LytR/AlgR family response regulator transcription factor n=1 Tax=Paraferrimonas sp. SM1919 TaxID=2662263 RepID=UPI0013D25877|nr:LytTR family DNA-binding domain-containing protein [Paraferrimonas sp. SM1919]